MASSAAYSPLPTNSKPNTGQGSHLVAVVSLLVTVVTLFLAFLFHSRWDRDISDAPFHLPTRQYTFTPDRRLQDFDQDTLKLWQTIVPEKWWETNLADWQDASGHQLSRAVDVIHMIHCLTNIRDIFTQLAVDPDYREQFNAHVLEAVVRRVHLGHCFDTIRQDILCAADSTLEPLGPDYEGPTGFGVEHTCRDWSIVWRSAGIPEI